MTTADSTLEIRTRPGTALGLRAAERLWPYLLTARLSAANYLTIARPRILLVSVMPRALLQTVFYTLLGGLVGGGDGRDYALTGAVAYLAVVPLVIRLPDIATEERSFGTLAALLTSRRPPAALMAARIAPYVTEALLTWLAACVFVPAVFGHPGATLHLLAALPAYGLVLAAGTAMGLAVTSTCLGRRSEITVSNTLAYLTLALGGVLTPNRPGYAAPAADLLPFRPALALYRLQTQGGWSDTLLLRTTGLSLLWAAAAWGIARILCRRSLRDGHHNLL